MTFYIPQSINIAENDQEYHIKCYNSNIQSWFLDVCGHLFRPRLVFRSGQEKSIIIVLQVRGRKSRLRKAEQSDMSEDRKNI